LWSDFFVDPNRIHAHRGYPLGLPLFEFHQQAVQGRFLDLSNTWVLGVFLAIWFVAFFDVVREFGGRTVGLMVCLIMMYSPVFFSSAEMAYPLAGFADFPVAALVGLASAWFTSWLVGGDRLSLFGSSAALTALAAVKNEGTVWAVLIVFLALASVVFSQSGRERIKELFPLFFPLIAIVVLRALHFHLPSSSDVGFPEAREIVGLMDAVPLVIGALIKRYFHRAWPTVVFPVVVVIGLAVGFFRQRRNWYSIPAGIVPAMGLTIVAVMGLVHLQLDNLGCYLRVTFPRLLFHEMPVALYWLVVLNSPAFPSSESSETKEQGRDPELRTVSEVQSEGG
jgi:hypothetical protein